MYKSHLTETGCFIVT